MRQWALGYAAPIYALGGTLSGYYVRSDVDTGRVLGAFDVSGAGAFAGLLYTHELERQGRLSHRLSAGSTTGASTPSWCSPGSTSGRPRWRSRPVSLALRRRVRGRGMGASTSGCNTPGTWRRAGATPTPPTNAAAPGRRRAGNLLRGGALLSWSLPARWTARGIFEGQLAGEALIPGEQFGLGGVHSVRGFSEREVSGDTGFRASLELWSPAVAVENLRFVLFADAGRVRFESPPPPGSPRDDALAGAGAGLRWSWRENVALLLDLGAIMEGSATREHGVHGHLNLLVKY